MLRYVKCVGLAAVLRTGMTTPLFAQDAATGVVKDRQEAMKQIGSAMKVLVKTVKGDDEADATTLKAAALSISDHAGDKFTALFPEGSLGHPSEAKAEIWQDWPRFETLSGDLLANAIDLAKNIEETGQLNKAAFMKVAGTCRDCHQTFREKD